MDEFSDSIKGDEWKDLILGLQETLDIDQKMLLERVGIKSSSCSSSWINGKRPVPPEHRERFLDFLLRTGLDPIDVIKFGSSVRHGVKVGGKWLFQEAERTGCKTIIIKSGGMLSMDTFSLFPSHINGHKVRFAELEDKIAVFYEEKRSSRPYPLILPKTIELDENFMAGLGIYMGEGSRNRKPKVTNSEPMIINQAIKFFSCIGTPLQKLRCWIQLHERSSQSCEAVKLYWTKNTELKEKNITSVRIKKSSGNADVEECGVLHMESPSILAQFLIDKVLGLVYDILEASGTELKIAFLQGWFAAEGSCELAKSLSVREVSFTSIKKEERELVVRLLTGLGIQCHEYERGYEIRIHGYENFRKLIEIDSSVEILLIMSCLLR